MYLALSLSLLSGFILMLTNQAVRKSGKVRLECAADTAMNAALSEFNVNLYERYELLYIDVSYLGQEPSASRLEERLWGYLSENTKVGGKNGRSPWGNVRAVPPSVYGLETAAAAEGMSMRNQAVIYAEDAGICREEGDVAEQMDAVWLLEGGQSMENWSALMEQIAGMELPSVPNEEGELEEVPLSNPADWAFGLAGSDLLYLGGIDMQGVEAVQISLDGYLSHRQPQNTGAQDRDYRREKKLFLNYLFDKLGYYKAYRDHSRLNCQLEYVASGQASDWKNIKAAAETFFRWRFADNVRLAMADGSLKAQAEAAAGELLAVQLKAEFGPPVVESILYACAFLESVSDIRILFEGGRIPIQKTEHTMSVDNLLSGAVYRSEGGDGWCYSQYLAAMLLLLDDRELNYRTMDIMEMDIRALDGNESFSMDWCVERFEAEIRAQNSYGNSFCLKRKYGYF